MMTSTGWRRMTSQIKLLKIFYEYSSQLFNSLLDIHKYKIFKKYTTRQQRWLATTHSTIYFFPCIGATKTLKAPIKTNESILFIWSSFITVWALLIVGVGEDTTPAGYYIVLSVVLGQSWSVQSTTLCSSKLQAWIFGRSGTCLFGLRQFMSSIPVSPRMAVSRKSRMKPAVQGVSILKQIWVCC